MNNGYFALIFTVLALGNLLLANGVRDTHPGLATVIFFVAAAAAGAAIVCTILHFAARRVSR